ncbi:SET [Glarea lozoyensis ATCC 20868]|uniref:SET n=1 Tax=Glarea lozoyensis (strain ATCC 20868 / MF5171) TaxID=1116229 RepID=S3D4E3_GLAL2|nr:SET [Glarea lozoyensis ATCC 20868]EPE31989.1 SET [Glarea lozoyensis ATCC 20868]
MEDEAPLLVDISSGFKEDSTPSSSPSHDEICKYILSRATLTAPLQILESSIPSAGLGLFATEDIPAAQDIFTSQPFMSCPISGPGDSECQIKAWKEYHKHECKEFQANPSLYKKDEVRSSKRVEFILQNSESTVAAMNIAVLGMFRANERLKIIEEELGMSQKDPSVLEDLLATDISELEYLLATKMITHMVPIQVPDGGSFHTAGRSLDFTSALINHSCIPNTILFFDGRIARARSLKPIKAGEELLRCYAEISQPILLRQQGLPYHGALTSQGIVCTRCEEELKEIEEWGSKKPELKHPLSCLRKAQSKLLMKMLEIKAGLITPQELSIYIRPLAKELFPDGIWPDHIEPIPRINKFCGDYYYNKKLGNLGLKYHLRGILCMEIRHCAEFVRLFMMMVYMMDMFLWSMRKASSSARSKMRKEGIPTEKEMTIVHQGYAHELARICVSLFGPDIAWSKAIVGLKEKAFNLPGSNRARLSVKEFDAAQSKLLAWATVEENRKIVLTDVSD